MEKVYLPLLIVFLALNMATAQWNESQLPNQITTLSKVGIGTNSLIIGNTGINDLVIGGASASHGLVINANSNNDGILAFASNGNMVTRFIYNNPSGTLNYYRHGVGNLFSIIENGNVGIGESAPVAKLHINGRMMLSQGVIQRGGTPITNTGDLGLYSHVSGNWIRIVSNNAPIRFFTDIGNGGAGNNIRMSIEANGNVGIGTTAIGSHKLAVEGTIGAREVKVTSTSWSDFVFEPDYDLPTLQEVENFINLNGHLQDIPSAEEVKAEGISLGEMDAKLLQKIEELTLYVITLEKRNKEQDKLINQLLIEKGNE